MHISRQALSSLGLDFVWWLVAPQNPLKDAKDLAPMEDRLAGANKVARHPKILIQAPELRLQTNFTHEVIAALQQACPLTYFVWLMGADNMAQFPEWRNWRRICQNVPIAVFDRPGYSIQALSGEMARSFSEHRLPADKARTLAEMEPPAWTFIPCPQHPQSATKIRKGRTAGAK